MQGSHNGPVIEKGSLENSLLWQKVSSKAMPPEVFGRKLPEQHIETIRRWIAGGALSDQPVQVSKETAEQKAHFEKEVLPLFTARCVQCHGAGKPMAGLDLRTLPSLLKGSTSGPVVIEGFSDKSVLIRKLASGNMPPKGAGTPLNESEIQTLRRWIDKGHFADGVASAAHAEREFTKAEAPEVTDKDREFWSFRAPVLPPVPKAAGVRRVRTPIDAFVLSKLEAKELTFSPDAPNTALMRRAYFDLIGLAPTPEEARQFLEDTKPGAYERLIDRLLASKHYGERWGRHWLDAVGYVDTADKDFEPSKSEVADGMWRYRDYVINATNNDKPWNRFLTEQLAGDELVDWRNAEKYTPEIIETLTATGYLRALDITNADILNLPVERYEALFKLVEKVSSSTIGLTMACARCHTHKFDPIPQKDYYRYLALFTSAFNPTNWLQPKNRMLYTVSKTEQKEIEAHNAEIDRPIAELKKQLAATRAPYQKRLFDEKLKMIPEAIRVETRTALDTPKEKRDEVQKFLVEKFQKQLTVPESEIAKVLNDADRATVEKLQGQAETLEHYRRKLERMQAAWDVGPPPKIRLLQRGSAESPGPRVEPGFPMVLCSANNADAVRPVSVQGKTSGLRLAYAQWLTDPANPLTARVIVNRIWQNHFGTGIVATPDNFGRTGSPPTHPELLDWLAVDFVKHGWSAKRLHKMIMTSSVYRQSSRQQGEAWVSKARSVDPQNQLLWRMNLRRLEAEILRDAILNASGKLDSTMGGPAVMLDMRRDGLQMVSGKEPPTAKYRRSVYLLARRTYPLTFMGVFDYPVIDTHCARRVPSATPLQSLTMLNDDFVVDRASDLAERVNQIAGDNTTSSKKIETAYSLTLSRAPSPAEVKLAEEEVEAQKQQYMKANVAPEQAAARAFAGVVQMLMASNEFLYIE
jgi:hypothetical protein